MRNCQFRLLKHYSFVLFIRDAKSNSKKANQPTTTVGTLPTLTPTSHTTANSLNDADSAMKERKYFFKKKCIENVARTYSIYTKGRKG